MKDIYGRELFRCVCCECGNETFVCFKPDGKRSIYCRSCLRALKGKYS